jgi:hypothetical protein
MRVARIFLIVLLLLFLGLILASSVRQTYAMESPNYHLDWMVPLSGGGGVSESANYAVHMTVGQTAVGSAEGTEYRANLGYWFGVLREWWTYVHLPIILR